MADAAAPVGIAELTAHFSLNHNAIRQHLAKLAAAQLVVETKVQSGGPGRPRLVYVIDPAAENRWGAIGPYERLSLLLAEIVLRQCPFESAARADRDTVCSLHLGLAEGLADETGVLVEELISKDPRRANCRLRLRVEPGT